MINPMKMKKTLAGAALFGVLLAAGGCPSQSQKPAPKDTHAHDITIQPGS